MKHIFKTIELVAVLLVVLIAIYTASGHPSISGLLPAYHSSVNSSPQTEVVPSQSIVPANTCNGLLVLVDKVHALPSTYAPPDLVSIKDYGIPTSDGALLRLIAIPDLVKMVHDANVDGVNLIVLSSYRSYQTQVTLFNQYAAANGEANANTFSAMPGHSQHQLGTAIDFSTSEINNQLDVSFGSTKAAAWMKLNAYKYGFVIAYPEGYESVTGYEYEPWHYRYIGVDNARDMVNKEMILQNYLVKYGYLPNKCI